MIIVPNHVYKFEFISIFDKLDNIYKVESVLSYPELVSLNIDLFKETYKKNDVDVSIFNSNLNNIRSGKIYKLSSIRDKSIHYIPEYTLIKIPDGTIQRYLQLGLAIDLGIFNDADQLSVLKDEIDQIVATMTGTQNKTIIYTVKDVWMTKTEYNTLDDLRKDNITKITNHYTDKLELIKQIDSLKVLVDHYENILKNM